jgi:predicted aspartyl protease
LLEVPFNISNRNVPVPNKMILISNSRVLVSNSMIPVQNSNILIASRNVPVQSDTIAISNSTIAVQNRKLPTESDNISISNRNDAVLTGNFRVQSQTDRPADAIDRLESECENNSNEINGGTMRMLNIDRAKMGKVMTTITVINYVDQVLAERGFIQSEEVRSITLNDVIVDTGATMLCLPSSVIERLGLKSLGTIGTKTAMGEGTARLFKGVTLKVEGREGTFDCVELPDGVEALLGVIPQEQLGLEPDLQNQRLRVLPNTPKDSYIHV